MESLHIIYIKLKIQIFSLKRASDLVSISNNNSLSEISTHFATRSPEKCVFFNGNLEDDWAPKTRLLTAGLP